MGIEVLTALFFGSLLLFLFLGTSLAWVLGGLSTIFLYFTWGSDAFYMVAARMWSTMNSFTLLSIPLFVFMADPAMALALFEAGQRGKAFLPGSSKCIPDKPYPIQPLTAFR